MTDAYISSENSRRKETLRHFLFFLFRKLSLCRVGGAEGELSGVKGWEFSGAGHANTDMLYLQTSLVRLIREVVSVVVGWLGRGMGR